MTVTRIPESLAGNAAEGASLVLEEFMMMSSVAVPLDVVRIRMESTVDGLCHDDDDEEEEGAEAGGVESAGAAARLAVAAAMAAA
jgi:hypothetical protein